MLMKSIFILLVLISVIGRPLPARSEDTADFKRTEDIIYGRKHGTALTMDVIEPSVTPKGLAAVVIFSGGWISAHEMINIEMAKSLLDAGYTVFAVVHGSQPKFTIPEAIEDIHRSVRYIRHHGKDFNIDPDRIALVGGSAGGHLALMIATDGRPGNPDAQDPVDRESSEVQAVACYFPPTDFLNYGKEGRTIEEALEEELAPFKAPFDFVEWEDKSGRFLRVKDPQRRLEIAKDISPITHVGKGDPPTFLIHGDNDPIVPIQQSIRMKEALEAADVQVKLVIRKGQGHGWDNWPDEMKMFADWFDKHLK